MLPGPTNVPDRIMKSMERPIINHRGEEFRKLFFSLEERCKKVFETEGDVVILTSSGTGAVEAGVANFIGKGDEAVVTVFGEFGERLADTIEVYGGKAIRVRARPGKVPSVEDVKEALDIGNPKALYLVYNETSAGTIHRDAKELSRLTKEKGVLMVLDAISVLGGDELPMDEWGIDVVIAGSQKALAMPPGLAFVSLNSFAKSMMNKKPPTKYFDLSLYLEYMEKGETPFTPAIPLFYALDEALNLVLEEGLRRRIERHRKCADAFYSAFEAMDLTLFADRKYRSNTVIAVEYPMGVEDRKLRSLLEKKYDVVIAGSFGELEGKVFRVGSMGEVNEEIVLRTVTAISRSLNELGFSNDEKAAMEEVEKTFG